MATAVTDTVDTVWRNAAQPVTQGLHTLSYQVDTRPFA
jgi:hypothetical protein